MSNEPGRSLLQSLWHAALMVTASVILIWIAVKLIEQIWIVLVILAAVGAVTTGVVIAIRKWLASRRW
jgi:hypothetical protein